MEHFGIWNRRDYPGESNEERRGWDEGRREGPNARNVWTPELEKVSKYLCP